MIFVPFLSVTRAVEEVGAIAPPPQFLNSTYFCSKLTSNSKNSGKFKVFCPHLGYKTLEGPLFNTSEVDSM